MTIARLRLACPTEAHTLLTKALDHRSPWSSFLRILRAHVHLPAQSFCHLHGTTFLSLRWLLWWSMSLWHSRHTFLATGPPKCWVHPPWFLSYAAIHHHGFMPSPVASGLPGHLLKLPAGTHTEHKGSQCNTLVTARWPTEPIPSSMSCHTLSSKVYIGLTLRVTMLLTTHSSTTTACHTYAHRHRNITIHTHAQVP